MKGKGKSQGTKFDMFDHNVLDADLEDGVSQQLTRLERQRAYLARNPQQKLREQHEKKVSEIIAWFDKHMMSVEEKDGTYQVKIYIAFRLCNFDLSKWQHFIESMIDHFQTKELHIAPNSVKGNMRLVLSLNKPSLSEGDIIYFNTLKESCIVSEWEQCRRDW